MTQEDRVSDIGKGDVYGCALVEFHVAMLQQIYLTVKTSFQPRNLVYTSPYSTFFTNAYDKAGSHGLALLFSKIKHLNLIPMRILSKDVHN